MKTHFIPWIASYKIIINIIDLENPTSAMPQRTFYTTFKHYFLSFPWDSMNSLKIIVLIVLMASLQQTTV